MAGRRKKVYLTDRETGQKTDMYYILDGLGKLCVERYGGRISTTVAQRYNPRISSLAHTKERLAVLLRLIRHVNPEYSKIKYEVQISDKNSERHFLTKEQEKIFYREVEANFDAVTGGSKKERRKVLKELNKMLVDAGSIPRNYVQMYNLIRTRFMESGKLPERLRNSRLKTLKEKIEKHIEHAEKENEEPDLEHVLGTREARKKKRAAIGGYLPPGHQNLVAYLIDPENYQRIFGEGVKLLTVDFNKEDTDPKLYKAVKERIGDLEKIAVDDEILDFVDGWIRFDILYKKPNGVYVIAEVKQRAIDKPKGNEKIKRFVKSKSGEVELKELDKRKNPKFDNACKALKQIGAYTGLVSEVVRKRDFEKKTDSKHVSLRIPVETHLVAYEIAEGLYNYLNSREGRGAHLFSREEVDEYVNKFLFNGISDKPTVQNIQKAKRVIAENKNLERHRHAESNFNNFMSILEQSLPGSAVLNEEEHVIEFGDKLYRINGSKDHARRIFEMVKRGVIKKGKINLMKYKWHRRVQI